MHMHTHTQPSSPKGEEVPNPTDRNDNERSRLVQPPTKNGEAARHRASRPRHSHCQAPPKKNHNSRAARDNVPSTLMCLEESAGGWQDPARTSDATI
jgi:hypothetical protein